MILWMLIHSTCPSLSSLVGTAFDRSRKDLGVIKKIVAQHRDGRRSPRGLCLPYKGHLVSRPNGNVVVRACL